MIIQEGKDPKEDESGGDIWISGSYIQHKKRLYIFNCNKQTSHYNLNQRNFL